VDWDEVDGSGSPISAERVTFFAGVLLLAVAYWYDTAVAHVFLVGNWQVDRLDWALLLALVVLTAYGVVPAVRNRGKVRRVLRRATSHPPTVFAGAFLTLVVAVGVLEPFVYPYPGLQFQHALHPPAGVTTDFRVQECLGTVTGGPFDRGCRGSLAIPLGADERGFPLSYLLVSGARVTLYVLVITAAFIVPVAATGKAATSMVAGRTSSTNSGGSAAVR